MFKTLIYKGIQGLKKLGNFLEGVYNEAYSQVEKEFQQQVEKIKERNKDRFIKRLASLVAIKCLNETGIPMPEFMAEEFAREMFKEAKKCGDLDILNRLKERN